MPGLKVSFIKNFVQGPRLIPNSPTLSHRQLVGTRLPMPVTEPTITHLKSCINPYKICLQTERKLFRLIKVCPYPSTNSNPLPSNIHPNCHLTNLTILPQCNWLPPVPNFQHNSKVPPPTLGYGQYPTPEGGRGGNTPPDQSSKGLIC